MIVSDDALKRIISVEINGIVNKAKAKLANVKLAKAKLAEVKYANA